MARTRLNVALLGGGSWGTAVAALVARNGPVTLWARDPDTVAEINEQHTNARYLPGTKLPDSLRATTDIAQAVLDVFHTEPLPAGHPFWQHPLVTVLPHVAAQTDCRSAAAVAVANLRAARDGRPLQHRVDRQRGY